MVPGAGIEPARLAPQDFKSCMSTYFIIRAETANCILAFITTHRPNSQRVTNTLRRKRDGLCGIEKRIFIIQQLG